MHASMYRVLLSTLRRWAGGPSMEFQMALWLQIEALVEGEAKFWTLLHRVQVELLGSGLWAKQSTFGRTGAWCSVHLLSPRNSVVHGLCGLLVCTQEFMLAHKPWHTAEIDSASSLGHPRRSGQQAKRRQRRFVGESRKGCTCVLMYGGVFSMHLIPQYSTLTYIVVSLCSMRCQVTLLLDMLRSIFPRRLDVHTQ